MFSANASEAEILAQSEKVANLRNQLERIRIQQIAALKAILTPEQKEKLQQLASERKKRMQQRRARFKNFRNQFRNNSQNGTNMN